MRGPGRKSEEILAPAAPHLWGETENKANLLLTAIDRLQTFGEGILRDVFSLLNRLGETDKIGGAITLAGG